jgi:hypothetical protein
MVAPTPSPSKPDYSLVPKGTSVRLPFIPLTADEVNAAIAGGNQAFDPVLERPVNIVAAQYVDSLVRNPGGVGLVYRPGLDDGSLLTVSEIGGHFTKEQLAAQAFVGAINARTGLLITQDDINLFVAHSQFRDQLNDFDARAGGVRYFGSGGLNTEGLLVQEAGHSLNLRGPQWNLERGLETLAVMPGSWALGGGVAHLGDDGFPHDGYRSGFGHTWDSPTGGTGQHVGGTCQQNIARND